MAQFFEYTAAELAAVPENPPALTLIELRALQLALDGDTFAPESFYAVGLASAVQKLDNALDELRARVEQKRREGAARP